ncbi:MAG: drug/metabolite transporter (DMT)-like permease [Parvicellaceae bacterium]|jgi:drug/metabolite transporter (DMT)-like permease
MNKNLFAHLAVFGANLIYGMNYTLAKGPMGEDGYIQPRGFIFIRVLGALSMFWLLRLFMKKSKTKITRKDYIRLAACGLFGVCINQMLFFQGLSMTSEINASIMMTSNPLLVLIIAAVVIGEGVTWTKIIGIVLGGIGATMIILYSNGSADGSSLSGDLLILANSASYGVYLVLVKPLMKKYNSLVVISWVFLFGALFVIPLGYGQFTEINWDMPPAIIGSVVFVVVCTTFLAYLLNIYAVSKLNTATVSAYIYLQPVLASAFVLIVSYDENIGGLTLEKIGFAILIFIGVYLVGKRGKNLSA